MGRTPASAYFAFTEPQEPLEFSGERYVPGVRGEIEHEHLHRYLYALQFCVGKDVLDVACGEGYGAELIGSVARSVVGVDSSAEAIGHAERHHTSGDVTFKLSDAAATGLPDDSIDTVVCFETIEHVADHDGLIAEIRRVLRPDGILVLSTPDRETYLAGQEPNPFHVLEFSHSELVELLERTFPNVRVGVQKAASSSVIVPDQVDEAVLPIYFDRINATDFEKTSRLTGAPYLIAVASGKPLPALAPSTLLDADHVPALHRKYRVELDRVWGVVAARDDDLGARKAELHQLEESGAAREAELQRVVESGAAREAALRDALDAAEASILDAVRQRDVLASELAAVRAELSAAYASLSWSVTRPLRVARRASRVVAGRARRAVRLRSRLARLRGTERDESHPHAAGDGETPCLPDLGDDASFPAALRDGALVASALQWSSRHRLRAELRKLEYEPLISILMPTFETPLDVLDKAVASVRSQTYQHWELIVVDDGSQSNELRSYLRQLPSTDARIHATLNPTNTGISSATNTALALARGEFVAMLDHDDEMLPDALGEVAKLLADDRSLDVVYTDQEYVDRSGEHSGTLLKPDWSPRLFWGVMFVGHLLVVRRSIARELGGFDPAFDNVQDFEFMLRVSERTSKIGHIPRMLYRWRRIPGSVAHSGDAKAGIEFLQAAAVTAHLDRLGVPAVARPHEHLAHRLTLAPKDAPPTSISVLVTGDDRRRAKARDLIVDAARLVPHDIVFIDQSGPVHNATRDLTTTFLLTMEAGIEFVTHDWLEHLLLYGRLPDVGVVSPVLLDAEGRVEEAGLILGGGGWQPAMTGLRLGEDGYAGSLSCAREVSAVSATCALVSVETLATLGGFAPSLRTAQHAWIELSLRATARGRWNVVTPHAVARRATRVSKTDDGAIDRLLVLDRWGSTLLADRFHNPGFALPDGGYGVPV